MADSVDIKWMLRCLELACSAEGRTAPNPLVGSVVLNRDGQVVGEGYHKGAGLAHAEVEALNSASAEDVRGGTLYVNLEPCCHFGRTPPCSDRVIESGVTRVVVGCLDPNPKVAGGGLAALRRAGIEVVEGVLAEKCRYVNRAFLKAITSGIPWLALKMAMSLDGRIADRSGGSRYVSGAEARERVMNLRNRFDCVMIGANTARLDNPALDVRGVADSRNPLRVVIDPRLSLAPDARVFESEGETVIFTLAEAAHVESNFSRNNARIVGLPGRENAQINLTDVLRRLKMDGVMSVLCEGGGKLAGALLEQGLVDELFWFVAPKMLIDEQALPVVASPRSRSLSEALQWEILDVDRLGSDVLIHCLAPGNKNLLAPKIERL